MYKYTAQGEYKLEEKEKVKVVEPFLVAGVAQGQGQVLGGGLISQAQGVAQGQAAQCFSFGNVPQGINQAQAKLLEELKKQINPTWDSLFEKSGLLGTGEIKPIPKYKKVGDLEVGQLLTLLAIHDNKNIPLK